MFLMAILVLLLAACLAGLVVYALKLRVLIAKEKEAVAAERQARLQVENDLRQAKDAIVLLEKTLLLREEKGRMGA